MSRLDEIKARLAAASPGPWYPSSNRLRIGTKPNGSEVVWGGGVVEPYDCEFISHARADIPWLVDLVKDLKQQVEDEENLHGVDIDARDRQEEFIADIARLLGCELPWSNTHDHEDCIRENLHVLLKE